MGAGQVKNRWEANTIPLTFRWARVGGMISVCIFAGNSLFSTVVPGLPGRKKSLRNEVSHNPEGGRRQGKRDHPFAAHQIPNVPVPERTCMFLSHVLNEDNPQGDSKLVEPSLRSQSHLLGAPQFSQRAPLYPAGPPP